MRIMFDGIVPGEVPAGAQLYAAYLDGNWADYSAMVARFPQAVHVSIAVSAGYDGGQVLDVENGDASPTGSVTWVVKRRAAGVDPTVYCSMSNWSTVQAAFRARGVAQPHYWIADYSLGTNPAIPAGAVALQYADRGGYDESVVADYWPGVDPVSASFNQEETEMIMLSIQPSGAINPGVWLMSGDLYVGIDTPSTVQALQGAGVQLATVDLTFHQRILAAVAAKGTAAAADVTSAVIGAQQVAESTELFRATS